MTLDVETALVLARGTARLSGCVYAAALLAAARSARDPRHAGRTRNWFFGWVATHAVHFAMVLAGWVVGTRAVQDAGGIRVVLPTGLLFLAAGALIGAVLGPESGWTRSRAARWTAAVFGTLIWVIFVAGFGLNFGKAWFDPIFAAAVALAGAGFVAARRAGRERERAAAG